MKRKSGMRLVLGLVALSVCACSAEPEMTIMEAADYYRANVDTFNSIRREFSGPYLEFSRIPARDPAKDSKEKRRFFDALNKQVSVEYIDFFPYADTGKDEINVILQRYDSEDGWNVLSLIYSDIALPDPEPEDNIEVFNACDQRAITWLESARAMKPAGVFCRINRNWYAHHKIS